MSSISCSSSWFLHSTTGCSICDNSSRNGIYSQLSLPSSYSRRRVQLNRVNYYMLKSLEARNVAKGALPVLRPCREGSRKLTTVRAQNPNGNGSGPGDETEEHVLTSVDGQTKNGEKGDGKGGGGGLSSERSASASLFVRLGQDFLRELKNETGLDSEIAKDILVGKYLGLREKCGEALALAKKEITKLDDVRNQLMSAALIVRHRLWPQFVNWNRMELWRDRRQWDAQRVGGLLLYALLVGAVIRGAQMMLRAPREQKYAATLAEAYLESVIPEPTPANVRKFRKAVLQEIMPEGFRMHKYTLGMNGEYKYDSSFIGDHPEDGINEIDADANTLMDQSNRLTAGETEQLQREIAESSSNVDIEPIDAEGRVGFRIDINDMIDALGEGTPEQREHLKHRISEAKARLATESSQAASVQGETASQPKLNWQQRLNEWVKALELARVKESLDTFTSKYVLEISAPELIARVQKAQQDELEVQMKLRAFWVAKTWWKYRPKIPYSYLLEKIKNGEVKTAVYSQDMKKLYVTMREGFPSEFLVDIPLDPHLIDSLKTYGVEVDILRRSIIYYFGRVVVVLLPSLFIMWYIREVQYRAKARASEKIYDLLSMNREHLILPEDAADKAKSQYKDVVVGGDVWQVIDEIMIYMRNPMKYHDKEIALPRGILISGPPGTGKTLLARAIARESGLPFVFASGAEFVESSTGTGTDKVFDIFFTARANAPSFVFIDEIDALAGKNAKDDAERRATFEQLLSELDGEPEDTDVDRYSHRQAVILICATNRPDELDEKFMQPGRIDREIYIGLPGEKERLGIFEVHSQGKRMAKDVDFSKLVFRTVGYSGADIRNLINEAGIMAVRKGHEEILQQDLIEVLDKQLFEGMGVVLMDEEQKRVEEKVPVENKRLLAVHEAGHVLLAHLFPSFDWHAFSHLLPGGSEAALSVFYPRQEMLERSHTTVGYVKMQMVVAHGGRCAERLIYGDNISDGGQDDLARISAMARELTISPANRYLGLLPMKWRDTIDPPKPPGEVDLVPKEWDKPGTQIAQMSVELSELFTREVTKYADETEAIAMTALSQNRHILERLADVLLLKTKLSGLEAEDIIRSMNPVFLPDFMCGDSKSIFKAHKVEAASSNITGRYEELNIYPAPLHRA